MAFDEFRHLNGSGARWVELGEGNNGDYDPNNPNDTELLRLDLLLDDSDEDASYTSYCTQVPTYTDQNVKEMLLMFAAGVAWAIKGKCDTLRKAGEALSWMDISWLDDIIYKI